MGLCKHLHKRSSMLHSLIFVCLTQSLQCRISYMSCTLRCSLAATFVQSNFLYFLQKIQPQKELPLHVERKSCKCRFVLKSKKKGMHVTVLWVWAIGIKVLHRVSTVKARVLSLKRSQGGRLIGVEPLVFQWWMNLQQLQPEWLLMGSMARQVWQQISELTNKEMRQLW